MTDHGVFADYEFAEKKIREIDAKLVVAPGNHDERNYGQLLFKVMIGPMDYEARIGKASLFLLNSSEPDRDAGRLGRRRQPFLENKLKSLSEDTIKIVVFHHYLVQVPYS